MFAAESDAILLSLICSGDEQAMGAFYDRHCNLVYTVALNILRDEDRAADATHDIFMQVWRSTTQFLESPKQPRGALAVSTWKYSAGLQHQAPSLRTRLDCQF